MAVPFDRYGVLRIGAWEARSWCGHRCGTGAGAGSGCGTRPSPGGWDSPKRTAASTMMAAIATALRAAISAVRRTEGSGERCAVGDVDMAYSLRRLSGSAVSEYERHWWKTHSAILDAR